MTILSTPLAIHAHLNELNATKRCWKIHYTRLSEGKVLRSIIEVEIESVTYLGTRSSVVKYYDAKEPIHIRTSLCPGIFFTSKEEAEQEVVLRKLLKGDRGQ